MKKPSTSTQANAEKTNGQRSSMPGKTSPPSPPPMTQSVNMSMDPKGSEGHRRFDKD